VNPAKRIASTLLVLALGATTACGQTGRRTDEPVKESATPMSEPQARDLTLVVRTKTAPRPQPSVADHELVPGPSGNGLLIDYAVTNTGAKPVVLNDRIPVQDGSASGPSDQIDPLKAFVLAGPDSGVTIAKRTFVQSGGPDFTVSFQGTVVQPGKTVRGRAFAPLPLELAGPGFNTSERHSGTLPDPVSAWRLCLGVTPELYQPDVLPDGKHSMVPNGDLAGDRRQRLLCSDPAPLPGGSRA